MNILEEVLFPVVDEINATLPEESKISREADAILFGGEDGINSMQLVSFVVAVEEAVMDNLGIDIVLADERAMSRRNSPFRNLAALADYIEELKAEA